MIGAVRCDSTFRPFSPKFSRDTWAGSLFKRAIDAGLVEVRLHNIRDWAQGQADRLTTAPSAADPAW